MKDEEKKALSNIRLEHAKECLEAAKKLFEIGDYKGSANRSYYAIYHSMRAVLALDGIDMSKHSGTISEFRKLYVKTGIFSEEDSNVIGEAFEIRTDADYDDFFLVATADIEEQIKNAEQFINKVENYLLTK